MRKYVHLFLAITITLLTACAAQQHVVPTAPATTTAPDTLEDAVIEHALLNEGVAVRMHGAIPDRDIYVVSIRRPDNFFAHREFPVVPMNAKVAAALKTLKRHDAVRIYGKFIANGAPQRHIAVTSIHVLRAYPATHAQSAPSNGDLAELLSMHEAVGKVHAIASDGRMLVFEYKSVVIPAMVADPKLTQGLYRNDKIRIRYSVSQSAHRPAHLYVDAKDAQPLVVLRRIADGSGSHVEIQGELVLFPKSPMINFDIYAIRCTDADGIATEYTLLNYEDMEVFKTIREKLATAWAADSANASDARNKLINPHIIVKVSGELFVQEPGQANPQILLGSPDDITFSAP